MTIASIARPEIRALHPYEAAAQMDDTIRLNANEAPWASRHDNYRRPLNRYPEIRPARLRQALAQRFACDESGLLVTRGSSEAIDLLVRAFCRAGQDNIVIASPTFSMYGHYAKIQGAAVREIETDRDRDFAVDADELIAACDDNTRLMFLCSPNNPTGTALPRETLIRVLEQRRNRSAVVVDEAYIEFSREASAGELLGQFDNLILLRTLSKAHAFAGARCGAVIGPADVIGMLNAVQAPYAIATPVIESVENALQDEWLNEVRRRISEIVRERERLMDALREHPLVQRIWPSSANFFLASFNDVDAVIEQTRGDRVLLRNFGGTLSDCVRITVGNADENERLLDSLGKLTGGKSG